MTSDGASDGAPSERKADVVAHALLERIVSGELPVGAILPREDAIAEEHGTSRSVVREAIKLLEVHRLVRPVRRRGTEVLDPLRSLSPEVVRAMLSPRPGVIDRAMLEGLLEVRALLDVEMSSLAAERRTERDLEALDRALAALEAAVHDPDLYAERSLLVGRALAHATQNPLFVMLYTWNELVAEDLAPLFRATRPAPAPHLQALTLLVALVRERDAKGVRELITTFHAWASPRLLQAAELARTGESFPSALPSASSRAANGASAPRVTRARRGGSSGGRGGTRGSTAKAGKERRR